MSKVGNHMAVNGYKICFAIEQTFPQFVCIGLLWNEYIPLYMDCVVHLYYNANVVLWYCSHQWGGALSSRAVYMTVYLQLTLVAWYVTVLVTSHTQDINQYIMVVSHQIHNFTDK